MNRDLGAWTSEDCALVLIDYQPEMFEAIRSETAADLVELHVRWLAKTAKAFDMPIVLSTVGVEYGIDSPTQPARAAWPHLKASGGVVVNVGPSTARSASRSSPRWPIRRTRRGSSP